MFADGQVPTSSRNLDIQCFAGIFLSHDYSFFHMEREIYNICREMGSTSNALGFAKLEPISISEQYGDFVTKFLEFLSCSKNRTR